ncbi:MAG: hypothetical protein HY892_16215 [Deltaproteobacteria bacterium]|nr:hypothetical protein [Deltaproteobacteria bacterium]
METGRELFNQFLKGEPLSRPAYVPLLRGLTARVGGHSAETVYSDPTLWANSLLKTAELFNFDGVVAGFDFSLMAEACGCRLRWENDRPVCSALSGELCQTPEASGRMKNALEAAGRVFQTCRRQRACIGALTGPVTLARQLFGPEEAQNHLPEVKELVVRVAEAFCQTRPDVLVFMEGRPLASVKPDLTQRRLYQTLKNITGYYNLFNALYLQGYAAEEVAAFAALKMDIYILGPSEDKSLPPLSAIWDLGAEARGIGLSLPLDHIDQAREIIRQGLEWYQAKGRRSFFFTSFGPVTRDVSLESLQQLIREISQVRMAAE